MRNLLMLLIAVPLSALAQPPNPLNNPNLPGYQNPAQQRLQTEMQSQQKTQQNRLQQQIQTESQQQQLQLNQELNASRQRVLDSQPGMIPMPQPLTPSETGNSQP